MNFSLRVMNSIRRLKNDLNKLNKDPAVGISAQPIDDSLTEWQAVIAGPPSSPYEGGSFKLTLSFPNDYPFAPPKVKFKSDVFHPNVSPTGSICLDILGSKWSPSYDVRSILISIQSLLVDPGLHSTPQGALNVEAEALYVFDRPADMARVRAIVRRQQLDTSDISTDAPSYISDD